MKNYIWIGVIVIILIALMVWGVSGSSTINPPFEAGVVHPFDNVTGNASSSVVVIEYSDFECPACRTYYPVIRQITTEFGSQIAFVYRDFPLIEIHPNAQLSSQAAQAAAKQGKFWQMHDLLFEKQNEWANVADPESLFESYAALTGINVNQFKTDITSKEVINFVNAQRASAIKLKLQGTPTFFVNGKQIQNPASVDAFRSIIKDAIAGKS
jgi:protein-disulfide isomerase